MALRSHDRRIRGLVAAAARYRPSDRRGSEFRGRTFSSGRVRSAYAPHMRVLVLMGAYDISDGFCDFSRPARRNSPTAAWSLTPRTITARRCLCTPIWTNFFPAAIWPWRTTPCATGCGSGPRSEALFPAPESAEPRIRWRFSWRAKSTGCARNCWTRFRRTIRNFRDFTGGKARRDSHACLPSARRHGRHHSFHGNPLAGKGNTQAVPASRADYSGVFSCRSRQTCRVDRSVAIDRIPGRSLAHRGLVFRGGSSK